MALHTMAGLYQVLEGCCLCLALSGKENNTFDHSEGAGWRKSVVWIHLLIGLALLWVWVWVWMCCVSKRKVCRMSNWRDLVRSLKWDPFIAHFFIACKSIMLFFVTPSLA